MDLKTTLSAPKLVKITHFINPSRFYCRDMSQQNEELAQIKIIEDSLQDFMISNPGKLNDFFDPKPTDVSFVRHFLVKAICRDYVSVKQHELIYPKLTPYFHLTIYLGGCFFPRFTIYSVPSRLQVSYRYRTDSDSLGCRLRTSIVR